MLRALDRLAGTFLGPRGDSDRMPGADWSPPASPRPTKITPDGPPTNTYRVTCGNKWHPGGGMFYDTWTNGGDQNVSFDVSEYRDGCNGRTIYLFSVDQVEYIHEDPIGPELYRHTLDKGVFGGEQWIIRRVYRTLDGNTISSIEFQPGVRGCGFSFRVNA